MSLAANSKAARRNGTIDASARAVAALKRETAARAARAAGASKRGTGRSGVAASSAPRKGMDPAHPDVRAYTVMARTRDGLKPFGVHAASEDAVAAMFKQGGPGRFFTLTDSRGKRVTSVDREQGYRYKATLWWNAELRGHNGAKGAYENAREAKRRQREFCQQYERPVGSNGCGLMWKEEAAKTEARAAPVQDGAAKPLEQRWPASGVLTESQWFGHTVNSPDAFPALPTATQRPAKARAGSAEVLKEAEPESLEELEAENARLEQRLAAAEAARIQELKAANKKLRELLAVAEGKSQAGSECMAEAA